MTDHDDFDRSLADRLRGAEGRVRPGETPDLAVLAGAGPGRWKLLGAGAVAAAALVLAVIVAPRLVAEPGPGASLSPLPSAVPSEVASPTSTDAPAPTAEPTPEPTPVGPITRWAPTATFTSEGMATETRDVTYAAGHFVAIGYAEPAGRRGEVGLPIDEPRMWISREGRSWTEVDTAPFGDAHFGSVVALPNGDALVYGSVDLDPTTGASASAAWRSTDGLSWARVVLDVPEPDVIPWSVRGGAKGYLTTIRPPTSGGYELWHSVDGLAWQAVHSIPEEDGAWRPHYRDWEAGPEGFVVSGVRYPAEGGVVGAEPFILASSDGLTWIEADSGAMPTEHDLIVAPIGPDWLIAARGDDGPYSTWHSANGLAWVARGPLDVPVPSHDEMESLGVWISGFVPTGDRVIASAAVSYCCHGPLWAAGVWWTAAGSAWDELGFPPGTAIRSAAVHGDVIVIAGFDQARPEDDFAARAVFWIGERE